ncbi:hypothetical protein DOTSEDRAFT_47557 [Dothistroma septosporum NZE10]|uniref:DUF2828 domain-containing protein n=1 Tax=Dothistroma septosporum (strain NZE10 / CBS 128990) TaxID=675120 RepID=N1PCS7_DOTSN|nr:hypothetical protein DOTSEDRAFT_47557 [Dothistroma septosporum NZE10]
MLTENADVAYRTTQDPLVDLCYELESAICGTRFRIVLEKAWSRDSKTALKIISNARSIHLGKGGRYDTHTIVRSDGCTRITP